MTIDAQRARVEAFYDEWTPAFVSGFGTTLQAGFLLDVHGAPEDPARSAVLLGARAGIRGGDRVLDAGCGVGGPAMAIAAADPTVRVHGVTVSAVQVATARELATARALDDRVSFVRGDYHALPFPDESFDVVVFLESCGYSADRVALFAEAARVTRRGGSIYVKDVFVVDALLTEAEREGVAEFDELWRLASSPRLEEVASALGRAGCSIELCGPLEPVGTDRFVAAMFEPDPVTILRPSALGKAFLLPAEHRPLFFGEVLARRFE